LNEYRKRILIKKGKEKKQKKSPKTITCPKPDEKE
jgi:hypothetical protein